jgi:hypothetical protein
VFCSGTASAVPDWCGSCHPVVPVVPVVPSLANGSIAVQAMPNEAQAMDWRTKTAPGRRGVMR